MQEEKRPKMISNFLHKNWTDGIDRYFEEELDYRRNGLEGKIFSGTSVHVKLEISIKYKSGHV